MDYDKVVRRIPDLGDKFYNEYVIDLETTGLDKDSDIIICLGIADLYNLRAEIYFLNNAKDWKVFYNFCRKKVLDLVHKKYAIVWAYSADFEKSFLNINDIRNLLCYTFYSSLDEGRRLRAIDACRHIISMYKLNRKLDDELYAYLVEKDISGRDIPDLYLKSWIILGDPSAKTTIIDHNYYDLIRGYIIRYHLEKVIKSLHTYLVENFDVIPEFLIKVFLSLKLKYEL